MKNQGIKCPENESLGVCESYQRMVEKQTGSQIKCVQSDNGKDYRNHALDQDIENCGSQYLILQNKMVWLNGKTAR